MCINELTPTCSLERISWCCYLTAYWIIFTYSQCYYSLWSDITILFNLSPPALMLRRKLKTRKSAIYAHSFSTPILYLEYRQHANWINLPVPIITMEDWSCSEEWLYTFLLPLGTLFSLLTTPCWEAVSFHLFNLFTHSFI